MAVPTKLDLRPFTRRGVQECFEYTFWVEFRRMANFKTYEKTIELHTTEGFSSDMNRFKIGGNVGTSIEMFSVDVGFDYSKAKTRTRANKKVSCKAKEEMVQFQDDVLQIFRTTRETIKTDNANKATWTKKDWVDTQTKDQVNGGNCRIGELDQMATDYIKYRFAGKNGTIGPSDTYTEKKCLPVCEYSYMILYQCYKTIGYDFC